MISAWKGIAVLACAALIVTVLAAVTAAAPNAAQPDRVITASDAAKGKLDRGLRQKVEEGVTEALPIYASLTGDVAAAKALVGDAHVAQREGIALLVGRIPAQQAVKLASLDGVLSVGLVQFKQDGEPVGWKDPELGVPASGIKNAKAQWNSTDVPYSTAPSLKTSNFEALRGKGYLDGKTHNFDGAWAKGFAGEGVTAAVLDGGTDWGHPDLLGTWKTWQSGPWAGWPMAFDPYDTLVWLAAPSFVEQGLSWYTPAKAVSCPGNPNANATCAVQFATRLGPSRNIAAPDAVKEHTYRFPAAWTKSGSVRVGSHPDDYLLGQYGERVAFLVTDPNAAGVYDTVYVDLDDDYDFSDEKPVTKASPASYRDMNGDGYTDLSGGLLAFISDGTTILPGGIDFFTPSNNPATPKNETQDFIDQFTFEPGAMLMWTGDYDPGIGGHGTLTASNVVGQAVANAKTVKFADFGPAPGAVLGGAPKAKLAPIGDIYFSFAFSTQLGYFLTAGNGVDVTSNSYGSSDVDNDGFDAASQEADRINRGLNNGATTPIFSTGNGAPGYGTTTPPSPSSGISVGASTQFGGTGWDSIKNLSQVADNDVVVWSNRGPGATGKAGVDLVADGAYSAGDATLNTVFDGRAAWETWGGTSRSTPVTVGAAALVYQAYRASHPGALPALFQTKVKEILKSSANDLGYDSFTQGSGSLDAGKAVAAATALEASVSPDDWRPGSYRGTDYRVFPRVLAPGGSDSDSFTISGGTGSWNVSSRVLKRVASTSWDWTSPNLSTESPYTFNAPDYLFDLSSMVDAHPDADLMVIRANYPRNEFDTNKDYVADQAWRLIPYKWNDVNGDGNLWTDNDHDGVVDHSTLPTTNIDGFNAISPSSEVDTGEYVRFMYHRPGANTLMGFVRDPAHRAADGVFLGLQHPTRNGAIPQTHFKIQVEFYKNLPWSWVTTPATATAGTPFSATMTVPAGTPYGMYQGAIVLTQGSKKIVVPTSVAVAATVPQDATTNELTGSTTFGGTPLADELYDNGSVFGANDWTWRAESGDWRFYFMDVLKTPPAGSLFLTNTSWDDPAPYTDIDTLVFGPGTNSYQLLGGTAPTGAPYILKTVGKSPNKYLGTGTWAFDTATGGASDLVTAPAQAGLHEIALHQVSFDGGKFNVPFKTVVAGASVNPAAVTSHTATGAGSFDVTFKAGIDLAGFKAEAFGLSQPVVKDEVVHQDNPNDPASASVKETVTIAHASRATFTLDVGSDDVDLFIVHNGQIVGSSTGGAGADETVTLIRPADGTYEIWLHGFAVAGTPTVKLGIDVVQGSDLTVTGVPAGAIPAGTPVTLHVTYNKAGLADGTYKGEILMGPTAAPTALSVPITVIKP